MKNRIEKVVKQIKAQINIEPELGIVVSYGLSEILERVENKQEIALKDIDGLVLKGKDDERTKFIFGVIAGKKVAIMYDRLHYYNGYESGEVVMPIYIMKELGCKTIIESCAVGAINRKIKVGDIVLFKDHINFSSHNSLIGDNGDPYGSKFFDMTEAYNYDLQDKAYKTGKELGINIKKGVYIEFMGPAGETHAEIHLAQLVGADVVGFHVANEVVAARYCGLDVIGLALVTNYSSAYSGSKLRHEDIKYNRQVASGYFSEYLYNLIKNL